MFDFFKKKKEELISLKKGKNFFGDHPEFDEILATIIKDIIANNSYIYTSAQLKFTVSEAYQTVKKYTPEKKKNFLIYLQDKVVLGYQLTYPKGSYQHIRSDETYNQCAVSQNLFALIMRSKLPFSEDEFLQLLKTYVAVDKDKSIYMSFDDWPIGFTANQFVKFMQANSPSPSFIKGIQSILNSKQFKQGRLWSGMDIGASKEKMLQALRDFTGEKVDIVIEAYQADGSEDFGKFLNKFMIGLNDEDKLLWSELLQHCGNSKGAKPKQVWSKKVNELIETINVKKYKEYVNSFVDCAARLEFVTTTGNSNYNGQTYEYTNTTYLHDKNKDVLKGLVWTLVRFHDTNTLQNIARLTEKTFQKIPGIGPAAAGLGNACIFVLAQSKGMEGISHLSRLKLRIRQNNTQKLINKYIEEQAGKLGLLPSQVEELAAPDFGLVNGERAELFDDYTLQLQVSGVGKAELKWFKPDGKQQKTVPAFVKGNAKHADKLKKMRDIAKQVKQASTAQRDRIDRLYTEKRIWSYEEFAKFYINHGLVSTIAKKLIWLLEDGNAWIPIYLYEDEWQDIEGKPFTLDDKNRIRLWHPIDSMPEEVLAWRDRFDEWQIQQPMKQAYRELYLLTDAEINTRIYSNRMASHFLKQHQFNALASLRGWKYSLIGCYDDGRDGETAEKLLPAYNMKAQFWIYEIYDDSESWNDAGIWDYVATDQIRFIDDATGEAAELIDVDKLVLSEIMRDTDLFVGVASVGNDPQWQDGAGGTQHDYWQSYSFGDLSEIAKTRKQVLERLVPRLKIRDVAQIEGKFLVVKGTRHTYKIHIGSTNILISPNDKYLCIVPSRGRDKNLKDVFLPFEGDRGLSIILSKAFMLVADDKITDKTILSQLQ